MKGLSTKSTATRQKRCKRQRCGISQREYETREDMLELRALVDSGLRPAQIAREMGKDPAWVSRSIPRLRSDPALAFRAPVEGAIIVQVLERYETIYRQAIRGAAECDGSAKAGLLKVAATVLKQNVDYLFRIGMLEHYSRPASWDTAYDCIRAVRPEAKQLGIEEAGE